MTAQEYVLSGDVPLKDVKRLEWGPTVEQSNTATDSDANNSCAFSSLCIELNPGDMKTFILSIQQKFVYSEFYEESIFDQMQIPSFLNQYQFNKNIF